MQKTVNNIPYLCSVADTKEFMGIDSYEYKRWLRKQTCETDKEYIEKYIPLFDKIVETDIDMLYLPKVFRVKDNPKGRRILERINSFKQQVRMNIDINYEYNLALVL